MSRATGRPSGSGPALLAAGALGAYLLLRGSAREEWRLTGRTVLVTGGSRGLGFVLAREAAAQGARVAICGRDADALDRAQSALERIGVEVVAVECDVTESPSVSAMIAAVTRRLGPVDMLINNAGVIEVGPAETMEVEDFEEAMATNFWGMLYPTLEVIPGMVARRSGRIVNITSIGGKLGVPHLLPYTASKFATVGFSQGLRAELSGSGVKVVTVVPGLMRTGSPRNAIFRGRHRAEYAWFSIADSMPGLSVSAETAARRIITGARRGDAEVLFPITTRLATVLNAVAPNLTSDLLSLADRLLPKAPAGETGRQQGKESASWASPSWLTRLNERAAQRYNQMAPAEPAP